MRRVYKKSRPRPAVGFIILPMIDVIFLLLLFFALMTNFEQAERVKVDVPRPDASQAHTDKNAKRVVINCALLHPDDSNDLGAVYRIGANPVEPLATISHRLGAAKAVNPDLRVVIRADRRLPFAAVRDVMLVVAENGVEIMNISAQRDTEQPLK